MELTIQIRPRPGKSLELYQTLQALLPTVRNERHCRDCRISQEGEVFFLSSRFQMAANSIWKMSVLDDSEWLTSRILPKRKVDGTAVMFQETRMHPTLMEPNPEWSQAKLVSLSRRQKITRLNRWGLQLEIEINMAEDPTASRRLPSTSRQSSVPLRIRSPSMSLPSCSTATSMPTARWQQNIYRGKSAWDAMQTEILYYHALQKLKNPLEMIDAKISEEMGYLRGKFNTIILPSQARAYVKTAKNQYLDYKLAGPAGPALARSDIHENARAGAYPGLGESIEVYSIKRTHAMSELTGGNDIMSTERTIGEYYVMQSSLEWDDARMDTRVPGHQDLRRGARRLQALSHGRGHRRIMSHLSA